MKAMKVLDNVAKVLAVVGSANWVLVGIGNLDLVDKLVGTMPWLKSTIYVLAGGSGVYLAIKSGWFSKKV